jgi:hypothetical protein
MSIPFNFSIPFWNDPSSIWINKYSLRIAHTQKKKEMIKTNRKLKYSPQS